MFLESSRPVCIQFPDREVRLVPGRPVEMPDADGEKILAHGAAYVREVRAVWWQSMDGVLHGPARVQLVARHGHEVWFCVDWNDGGRWVRDVLLRPRPKRRT